MVLALLKIVGIFLIWLDIMKIFVIILKISLYKVYDISLNGVSTIYLNHKKLFYKFIKQMIFY